MKNSNDSIGNRTRERQKVKIKFYIREVLGAECFASRIYRNINLAFSIDVIGSEESV
jgi:hypothetical protein